jgi:hypothetical protein
MTEFVAKHAELKVNDVTMAAAKNWRYRYGFTTQQEPVCNTDIPRVLHGVFKGEVECESIYVSNDNWQDLHLNRDVVYTVISKEKDTNSPQGTRTTTMTVKLNEFERTGPANADGIVRATARGVMTDLPVVT